MVCHRQMANIPHGARYQEIPHHFWLRGRIEDADANEREQTVYVAELKDRKAGDGC